MRAWFTRMMAGRNGPDHLNRFLSVVFLILSVCSVFVRNARLASVLYTLSMALFVYVMFRMLSRNIYRRQQENGAHVLDVNVGIPEINETEMLGRICFELQAIIDLPLQIDTSDPVTMEKALRIYNGKPLINSVNGKQEVMKQIFPLVK